MANGADAAFLVRLSGKRPEAMTRAIIVQHVEWLRGLHDAGRLIVCGPCDDGTAIIVLSCATLDQAKEIAHADPFRAAGAVTTYEVVRMRLATSSNDFLLNG